MRGLIEAGKKRENDLIAEIGRQKGEMQGRETVLDSEKQRTLVKQR